MKKWYIIHVASGHERKVSSAIMERAQKNMLAELIDEVIVPTEEVEELRRGKKVNTEKKILPGYILIKMNMDDRLWHLIRSIPKVSKFLGADGKPLAINDSEAEKIFKQMQEGSQVSKSSIEFEVGESVRVIDGPFDSFTGVVLDLEEDKKRLKVSVSIFGRATPIDLDYAQVEKL
jgi:transcriptional antiterminator NusG